MALTSSDITKLNTSASLPVSVALGLVKGMSSKSFTAIKRGAELTRSVISDIGAYVFPSDDGEAMEVVSSSVSDTTVEITVVALDENGLEKSQTKTLNGTTPIPLDGLMSRVNLSFVSGSSSPLGNVTVRQLGGGNVFSLIDARNKKSFDGVYTVPANLHFLPLDIITTMTKTTGSNTSVVLGFTAKKRGGVFTDRFFVGMQRDGDTAPEFTISSPTLEEPLTDILIDGEASAADTDIFLRVGGYLIDKDNL